MIRDMIRRIFDGDYEDDGVIIRNGIIISKGIYADEEDAKDEIKPLTDPKKSYKEPLEKENAKVEEVVEKCDIMINSEQEVEGRIYEELGGVEDLQKSKGRTRDIEGFYLTLQSSGKSKQTISTYRYAIEFWDNIARKKNKSIYSLKLKDIEEANIEQDINTVKKRVSALKQLAKWYLRDGFPLLHIECQKIMLGKGKSRIPKAKGQDEFIEIKKHANELIKEGKREGIWISLMLLCGLRISEIETVIPGENFITVIGKGDKERKIPCSKDLLKTLKTFKSKGRGGYKAKRHIIHKCLSRYGYTHLHTLRHTYATVLHQRGLAIEKVSHLLGHSSVATTQIYAQTKVEEGITELLEKD